MRTYAKKMVSLSFQKYERQISFSWHITFDDYMHPAIHWLPCLLLQNPHYQIPETFPTI